MYISKHFRCYLDGMKFSVIGFKVAFCPKQPGHLARWATVISQYTFDIVHRKGTQHVVPDALSRIYASSVTFDQGPEQIIDR